MDVLQERLGPEPQARKALRWGTRWLVRAGILGSGLDRATRWLHQALRSDPPAQVLRALWRCTLRASLQQAPEAWLMRCLDQAPRPRRRRTHTDLRTWRACVHAQAKENWTQWIEHLQQTP